MRTYIILPPLGRMSGGLSVLIDLGRSLLELNYPVLFVSRDKGMWLDKDLPALDWNSTQTMPDFGGNAPGPEDIWLAPEGWPSLLLPGLRMQSRVVVYTQNWAYLFGSAWPAGIHPSMLPLSFLAVSQPVAWYIQEITGQEAPVLRPGLDLNLFQPLKQEFCVDTVSIAWMPRKNSALAKRVREIVDAKCAYAHLPAPQWNALENLTRAQVAENLQKNTIFLSTGFPEGCPLPPLEALASGCLCAGFSGFGGWDYMRMPQNLPGAADNGLPGWLPPTLAAKLEPRPVNGFWTPDSDVIGAAMAILNILAMIKSNPEQLASIRQNGFATAKLYSKAAWLENIQKIWHLASQGKIFCSGQKVFH